VRIAYDPKKRAKTIEERGLDFDDAAKFFAGLVLELEDSRFDYGETRMICYGYLGDRMIVVGYTLRESVRHVFSMRRDNAREQRKYGPYLKI
jgi:uncharacterized DUF497 family protein